MGHHTDAGFPVCLYHRIHDGRSELCDHCPPGSYQRHDTDANALVSLGYFHGYSFGAARFPRITGQRHHDDIGPSTWHQLLYASDGLHGRAN